MKHVKLFEAFVNEAEETAKKAALDFVENKGKATWKEIHSFLMKNKGLDPNDKSNRGNMSSYFSGGSTVVARGAKPTTAKHGRSQTSYGVLMIPTTKDPRYLEKDGKYYVIKTWDGKSNIG